MIQTRGRYTGGGTRQPLAGRQKSSAVPYKSKRESEEVSRYSWTCADKNSSLCSGPPQPRPPAMQPWNLASFILIGIFWDAVHVKGTALTLTDCCLHTSDKKIPFSVISGYEIQNMDKGCPRAAVVFFTKPSITLCATPGLKWVEKTIKKLDYKKRNTKRKKGGSAGDGAGKRNDPAPKKKQQQVQ
ncbi:C-C motif chemokine 24-like [Spea bombifrons]|uniref:C-C motif chemokine 24-like n=1 Tax=Spea bombifrons TaxID=233779 RepID=UPI0023498141|nr:C-C motif chemokine 24-like [Spea bombifrons]